MNKIAASDEVRPSTEISSESEPVSQLVARRSSLPFVFFGTGPIAVRALDEMHSGGMTPALIVSSPDRPAGRGRTITASPVAQWAETLGIETHKPEKLDNDFLNQLEARSSKLEARVFVVIDYGKFLPKRLLDIPERGVLNMHPSLLPRLRGPSPIRSAILQDEKDTGITVMLVDEEMDHGGIVAQKKIDIPEWPPRGSELDALLGAAGGKLMTEVLPLWERGEIEAHEQNHDVATFSHIFSKEDGLLDLSGDPYQTLLKIRAFEGWPGTYTYFERGGKRLRVQIIDAHMEGNPSNKLGGGMLVIDTVKPEGKGETSYSDFIQTGATLA